MTRKRKNVEEPVEDSQDSANRTFPKKNKAKYGDPENQRSSFGNQNEFGDGYSEQTNSGYSEQPKEEERVQFPTDLVAYLRNFVDLIQTEGKLEEEVIDKIAEECRGSEELLLKFFDSCKVVEQIFGSSDYAAPLFLSALFRIKHKKLIDLFFSNSGARTIEKLLIACVPVSRSEQIQVLSILTDLLCENWNDAVTNQPSSFLIRCLVKVLCGTIHGSETISKVKHSTTAGFPNTAIGSEMSQMFNRIADLAIDHTKNADLLENPHCSLAFYDILDCDAAVQGGKCTQFVKRRLAEADGLTKSFCGKGSSRIWDRAIIGCSEAMRSKLWSTGLKENVESLAFDRMGNHPLQNFIKSVESPELAKEVCEAIIPFVPKLFQNQRNGVVTAVVKCSHHDLDAQEKLIKQLRTQFRANKASQKDQFFLNILTNNKYDGNSFNVQQVDVQGSYLVQALLELEKVKTLCSGILALDKDTVMNMALDKTCAFVVQAILKSKTVENDVKIHIIKSFEGQWVRLIEHPIGSRTFDVIWDSPLTSVDKKQTLLKGFVNIRNTSKNWKFAMLRCDMNLFRKDRKAWVTKMKSWNK